MAAVAPSAGLEALKAAWSSGKSCDCTDPSSIQQAIDDLDQYQNQKLSSQPGDDLDEALGQLADSADKVIAESPESNILPHISTYKDITTRMRELEAVVARKAAEQDVAAQVAEFEERLADGGLSDAAYCCVRLAKMAQDAEEELAAAEAEARRQQAAAEAEALSAQEAEGGGASAGGAGPGSRPRVTTESVALLQETAERCSSQLQEALDGCCEEAVWVDPGGGRLVVRAALRGGRVRVAELFAALQVVGLRGSYLRRMTGRLVNGALKPMLAAPCRVAVQPADEAGGPAALAWQPLQSGAPDANVGAGPGGGAGGPCDPEHCVQLLLRLLATWLLEFDEGLMELFGGPFWRAAADCYIACVAAPYIAANPEDVDSCAAVAAAAADLEAMAESLNFTNGEEPYLAPAVEQLARHALSSRQEKYLERARQLLLGHGHAHAQGQADAAAADAGPGWDTVTVGAPLAVDSEYYRRLSAGELQDWEVADPPTGVRPDGPLQACGTYQVTRRAEALGGLLRELVQDACGGSRAVCRALRSALASITLLTRALPTLPPAPVPTVDPAVGSPGHHHHQQQPLPPSSVPQLGLLAANDLSYMAEQLLLLAGAYGAQLEAAGGEPAVPEMVEEAAALRSAARGVMREQLQAQCSDLDQILAGLDGLRRLDDSKVLMRHRRVIQQLLHSLGRLGRAASEVLTPEGCCAAAATALNHVCGQLVAAVLTRSDLSADECSELAALLAPLGEGALEAWLGAARAAGPELSGIPVDVVVAVGLLKTHPESHPYVRFLLLPGTIFEAVTLSIDECYVNPSPHTPCNWGKLLDLEGLLEKADYRDKVEVFSNQMGDYRQWVQASAAAATIFSVTSAILDGTVGLVGGYAGMAYLVSKAGCNVVAPTNLCVAMMIAVYVIMAGEQGKKDEEPAPADGSATPVGAEAALGAGGAKPVASKTPAKAGGSPKKRR
ncbi:hypothetical protein GPECTOR_1g175 [Gonium pectorale]|uniref:Uncharacterized protein n=1 Tax=Gonium pectorale TaxID=33097 RepID=A0A150H2J2_GONPE|nr:hypothetical protein GPECTOR_1g175 [Gonium pectorale]|eukprot:KXZ56202.1 hypothetical protein GPECTOR_1g175 [Gonium pectorale]